VWTSSTSDTRALQKASNPADRIAACWYSSGQFSIELAFNDSNTHQVAVYLVDWDHYNGRTEKVDVIDANNNLLDTRSVASFGPGEYLVWNLSGHVILRVTNTNPSSNAVVSGLFFGTLQPTVSVSVSPSSVNLLAGGSQQFSTTVLGSANTNVTWSLSPNVGTISAAGLYTAPAIIAAAQTVTVKATSVADPTKFASATVTLSPATTPYAAWKLDDGSGTAAADSSGNNLTASLFNGPAWLPATQCIAGGCLSFNGTTQYGSVALNLSDTTAVTVSFWLKWNAYAKDDKLALEFGSGAAGFNSLATGFMIDPNSSYQDGTTFEAGLRGNGGYNQVLFTRPSAGVWHHYAFVLNKANPAATEVIPYVDGVAVAYTKPTSSENSNGFGADTLYLMSRNGTSLFGAGALNYLRIYKRPLPASEIAALSISLKPVTISLTPSTLNPPISVTVTPASVTLTQSQTQGFAATVTNTSNTVVMWSLSPLVGSISAAGLYTAPALIASSQTVTVKATSVADSTIAATTTVTLNPPVNVTVTPATVTLTQSQPQSFSATVTNTGNTAVTWSLSPLVGSITAAGLYTAPASIASPQTVTVKATSVADPTKSATATVTLNPPVNVTVAPASVTLTQSQTQSFSATVTNTGNTAVTWSLSPLVGSITATGLYTAPASITSSQTVTVKATSVVDPTKSATASVTLNPPMNVTVSPVSVILTQSQSQSFSATVTNTSNTAVTWSLSPVAGSITAAGVYTAPASITSSQTVTVKATSVADATKSATVAVTLNPPVGVTVAPASVTLTQSQTQTFSATVTNAGSTAVTWSISPVVGSITAAGLYSAPASITSSQTVTVKATSVADPTKSASATVTLNPPVPVNVTVNPASVTLTQSQTQTFSATVTNTGNTAVTWSLSPVVGSITAAGLYTAPASITSSQTVTVKATSVADPTKSATATVTLTPRVAVSLTPSSVSLLPSQNQTFTATVSGTSNTAVTWSINPALGGLASSATTAVYVAPSTAPTTQNVIITATSMADPSKTVTAVIILLQAVTISLSPSTVSLAPSGTQQFTATVLGTSNTAVTWSINPSVGTISSAGLYTAPSSILTSQTVTVTARSVADPTKSASAPVSLSTPVTSFTYYVDSANGSDSNPGNQAAPWKTIAKVNSTTLTPGQSVGFARGGVWRETLTPGQSGTAGSPIMFTAYGTGPKPLFLGSTNLTGATWSTTGTPNVYTTPSASAPSQLFVDNARAPLARWPASGWQSITTTSGDKVHLIASGLTQADNYWVGNNAVIKTANWMIEETTITASSSSAHTITWSGNVSQYPTSGYGFYIEGNCNQLSAAGQWCYAGGLIYLQLAPADVPVNHAIEATARYNEVNTQGYAYLVLRDLDIRYGTNGVYGHNSSNLSLINCNIAENNTDVLINGTASHALLDGNTISGTGDGHGVSIPSGDYATVTGNTISNIASDTGSRKMAEGLYFLGSNGTVSGNTVSNTGGHCIVIEAGISNTTVSNNLVSACALNVTDNGGIYLAGTYTNVKLTGNTVHDMVGDYTGTPGNTAVVGIYLDEPTTGVTVAGNVVYNIAGNGINLHRSYANNVVGNTIYNPTFAAVDSNEGSANEMYGNVIKNNIFVTTSTGVYNYYGYRNGSSTGFMEALDYNLYYYTGGAASFGYGYRGTSSYSLTTWRTFSGMDAHSVEGSPLFTNAGAGDFTLQAGSPAIGAGVYIPGVSTTNSPNIGAK
jgi:parallel beta-helix repeat protein